MDVTALAKMIIYLIALFIVRKRIAFFFFSTLFLNDDKRRSLDAFVNQGYKEWHNIKEKELRHSGNSYHQQAVHSADGIIAKFENPGNTIPVQVNEVLKERHQVYKKIVEALARVIHLLGNKGLHCVVTGKGLRQQLERTKVTF